MHLGLIGYGSIAQSLIPLLPIAQVTRVTVLVRDTPPMRSRETQGSLTDGPEVNFITSLDAMISVQPDVIVECASHGAVIQHAPDVVRAGIDLILALVGTLADSDLHKIIKDAAQTGPAELIIPTGAIGGLDLLKVLSATQDVQVTYQGIKPPAAWKGSPAETCVDLERLTARTVFFAGTGREAALTFPKNANVVAALALAGAGFDEMQVELIADPAATSNIHAYQVTSRLCSYKIEIENTANPNNARTSMTTVLSILEEVLKLATAR